MTPAYEIRTVRSTSGREIQEEFVRSLVEPEKLVWQDGPPPPQNWVPPSEIGPMQLRFRRWHWLCHSYAVRGWSSFTGREQAAAEQAQEITYGPC